jgi:O-antigen ligase
MAQLIREMLIKFLTAFLIVSFFAYFLPDLLSFGESAFQSRIVFSFFVYCALILFGQSEFRLFHVISIPVLTQFLHIFQKFSFETGANSIWRIAPFLILDLYFIQFFFQNLPAVSKTNRFFILSWILIHTFLLLISPNLSAIFIGGLMLYLFTLPGYFLYLNFARQAIDFRQELEKYLCLLFLILAFGTFGLVYFAADYKGSDNLLATRNIADMNVTMAYFILLWPFAILFANRQPMPRLSSFVLTAVIVSLVVLSFSRGAVLIVLPYVLASVVIMKQFSKWLLVLIVLIYFNSTLIAAFLQYQDLAYFWSLRFADVLDTDSFWDKLQASSGRSEIQNIAYDLFVQKPLTGHGIGSFELLGPGFREAHSIWYTLLAEEGIVGITYFYLLFFLLASLLVKNAMQATGISSLLAMSFLTYLVFNHTVGSVFVIIPGKSISVNCMAPVLLLCLYFYVQSAHESLKSN